MLLPLPTTLPLMVAPASIVSTSLVPPNWIAVPPVPVMVPLLTSVVVPPEVAMPVTPLITALLPAVMKILPAVERDAPIPTPVLCTPASTSILMSPSAAALGEDAVAVGSRAVGDHIAFGAQRQRGRVGGVVDEDTADADRRRAGGVGGHGPLADEIGASRPSCR